MKRLLLFISSIFFSSTITFAQPPFTGLVLEEISNFGFINGEKTYRLYAELSSGIVTQMFGDETRPHSIVTTTTFFNQDLFGGHSNLQSDVNTGAYAFAPLLEYDTWATLGDSYTSGASTLGDVAFGSNLFGSTWSFGGTVNSDASIFRVSTDPLCVPDANGRVLLGQFTTDGVLSGFINLNGLDGAIPWQENQIPIPSIVGGVSGCTDSTASNYDATAVYDDSTCTYGPLCLQDGDANCDNTVDLDDLFLVLNNWLSTTVAVGTNGDVIGSENGVVDLDDLFLVLNNWLQITVPLTGPSSAQLLRTSDPSQSSSFVGLSMEVVDNSLSTFTNGEVTYRLYAELNSSAAKLLAIFGDESNPHLISTTGIFYQDMNASDFQHMINPALIGSSIPGFENIGFDSWLTIGDNYTPSNNVSSIGELNWPTFSASSWIVGGLISSDAAIFRMPSDDECLPDNNNKVLLGQFTTDGVLSGFINLTGLNPDGSSWIATNIPIPSLQSPTSITDSQIEEVNIYPNPTSGMFNIEFSSLISQDINIKIINTLGEAIFIDDVQNLFGNHNINIDLSAYAKGIYFLELSTREFSSINKIKLQ